MLATFYVRALTQSALYAVYKNLQLVTKALLDFYKIFSRGRNHGKPLSSTQPSQVDEGSDTIGPLPDVEKAARCGVELHFVDIAKSGSSPSKSLFGVDLERGSDGGERPV